MSPRATALFCSFLAAALLASEILAPETLGTSARAFAEEANEPAAEAKDDILAGEIGRALLSSDKTVRAKAVRRLSQRLDEGRRIERFLQAMSKAQEAWANEHARMLEVWLVEAVNATGKKRLRALRLLSALGPQAVRRLADELHHRDHHGTGTSWTRNEKTLESENDESVEVEERTQAAGAAHNTESAAGIPYRYELGDLIKDGWRRFDLRSMLLREGDASRVVPHDTGYIVTAPAQGHKRLRTYLTVLRSGQTGIRPAPEQEALRQQELELEAADKRESKSQPDKAPVQTVDTLDTGSNTTGRADKKPVAAAAEIAKRAKDAEIARLAQFKLKIPQRSASAVEGGPSELVEIQQGQPPLPEAAPRPQWRVEPMILYLPSSRALGARLAAEAYAYEERKAPFENSRALTGTLADVKHWADISGRMAEARADLNLSGNLLLAPGRSTRLRSGKEIRYSRDVQRLKGGAWRIVEGTIHDGIEIEIAIIRQASGLRVDVVAQRTDVGSPVSVVSVRPSLGSVAVELERPEWSTTRLATSFVLPGEAGGAFLPLEGLGKGEDEEVVLVLAVAPHANRPAVRKSRVILPQNRK